MNNIVGYLQYDETLFDDVKIEGINEWHFEQNQDKSHERYGKFVIYTMKDGVDQNQNIAELTLKLKKDLKPQKTEIKFTKLQSSDGEVSVDEDDKKATIEIYEETQEPEKPEEPQKPEAPVIKENQKTPEDPGKTEEPEKNVISRSKNR